MRHHLGPSIDDGPDDRHESRICIHHLRNTRCSVKCCTRSESFFLIEFNFWNSFFCAVTKIDLWAFTFPDILFQWYHIVQMTNILKTQSRWMDYSFTLYLSSQNSAFSPRVLCSNFLKISRNFRSRHLINTESIKGANKKEMSDTLYITQKLRWLDWWWLDSQS